METKKTFSKLNAIFDNVDGSSQNHDIFIKFPDYAWPRYFGAYMKLLLKPVGEVDYTNSIP